MLKWALLLLVVAMIAGYFGFTDVSTITGQVSKILFFICLLIFILMLFFAFRMTD